MLYQIGKSAKIFFVYINKYLKFIQRYLKFHIVFNKINEAEDTVDFFLPLYMFSM